MQVSRQLQDTVQIIARVFAREADEELIRSVQTYIATPFETLLPKPQASQQFVSEQIQKALGGLEDAEDRAEWFDYLAASYAELFLGVAEDPIAPFESVYLGSERTLYERQYFEVMSYMREGGFTKPRDFQDPEDHLALEWAFVSHLLSRSSEEREAGRIKEADELDELCAGFLAGHLSLWNDAACDDIISKDDSNGFYGGFALLGKVVLAELEAIF